MNKSMNIPEWQSRTDLLVGSDSLKKLNGAHILIVGLGGVGGYVTELLCRSGIGQMTIVDGDDVEESNRNRQLPALQSSKGRRKVDVVAERLFDINPGIKLNVIHEFLRDERLNEILTQKFDYVVDAIDTLSPKVYLISNCLKNGLKIVSSMGAGGKFDPAMVRVSDIADSYNCKLAKAIRKRLHRLGIHTGVKVVFSPEPIVEESVKLLDEEKDNQKSIVGTISYLPAVFGCFCASVVLRELTGN